MRYFSLSSAEMGFDSLPIYKINHGPVHSASQAECMMSTPTEPLTSYCRFRSAIGTEVVCVEVSVTGRVRFGHVQ